MKKDKERKRQLRHLEGINESHGKGGDTVILTLFVLSCIAALFIYVYVKTF